MCYFTELYLTKSILQFPDIFHFLVLSDIVNLMWNLIQKRVNFESEIFMEFVWKIYWKHFDLLWYVLWCCLLIFLEDFGMNI